MPERGAAVDWIGYHLEDVYGGPVGKVEDVYVDDRSGAAIWLVARLGRFGDEHVPIPAAEAVIGEGRVWVPHERQVIKSAGRLDPGAPVDRDRDLALAAHYGIRDERERDIGDLPGTSRTCHSTVADTGETAP